MDARQSEFSMVSGNAQGSLRPITSHGTGRYETSILVEPFAMEITSGLFTTVVVTEAYLYRPETLENVCLWIDRIQEILSSTKTAISRDAELFIKLENVDCSYYFVDHVNCSEVVLEELYWIHVENFPMHLEALSPQTLDEIIGIFSHGLCAQQCKSFVAILQSCRGNPPLPTVGNMANGHTTWIIVWGSPSVQPVSGAELARNPKSLPVSHNQCITHYGQEHARLSRDQAILFDPEQKHSWISTIMAAVTFNTSDRHLARLNDVFVDHIVYVNQWERLMSDCLREWRRSVYVALSGLMLHSLFLLMNSPSRALLAVSIAVFCLGLVSSMVLGHKYEPMQGVTATKAINYLETVQFSVFKFQLLAFAFSLPKAPYLWGFVVFLSNYAVLIVQYLGWGAGLGFSGTSLLLVLSLYCTTSEAFHTALGKLTGAIRRSFEDTDAHMV
ncbi:hypothetical protein B0H17DRAFT_1146321 [Mycena rosella]|uniref:Uncharacterized protein n=1 Tax=Mycena rosella TaxID=1033263 RepID=A0AAD7CP61_MYCRO|nr:hypothetical protein B0H17DRAFT_1146321 [Mycena rosella]